MIFVFRFRVSIITFSHDHFLDHQHLRIFEYDLFLAVNKKKKQTKTVCILENRIFLQCFRELSPEFEMNFQKLGNTQWN